VVSVPPGHLDALRHDPDVAYVAPDRPVRLLDSGARSTRPAVPTGVARIGAAPPPHPDGSAASRTGPAKKTAVAILDTGVMNRPDLNLVGGHDCSSRPTDGSASRAGDGTTTDENGHGTHVAGIVADNGIPGVIGVSPNTPLYAVRVMGPDGSGDTSNVICGLNWVADHAAADNIKVLNLSLGGPGSDDGDCGQKDHDALHTAICRVTATGVTVVVAAGNDSGDLTRSVPAAFPEVLAVTAMADFDGDAGGKGSAPANCSTSNRDDTAADYSDYAVPGSAATRRTIAAPGDCIISTWNDGGTKTLSGTSMAAPHVAGLVARCIEAGPCADLSPTRIVARLRADAAARPANSGFLGDSHHPVADRYYGDLAVVAGY
jgi:subtilisin family serine protease